MGDELLTLLCQEIKRLSEDGSSVTFGLLFKDEAVSKRFETLIATVKAAKAGGYLTFEGDGDDDPWESSAQHEDLVLTLLELGLAAASGEAVVPSTAAEEEASAEAVAPSTATEEAAAPAESKEDAGEAAPSGDGAGADTTAEPAAAEESNPDSKEQTGGDDAENTFARTEGGDPSQPLQTQEAEDSPDLRHVESAPPAEKKEEEEEADNSEKRPSVPGQPKMIKDENGKWVVDTSYIDWRTADPNRLEQRRSLASQDSIGPGLHNARKSLEEDGKWASVDVGYINHRTSDCDRLEARRSGSGPAGAVGLASATTAKVEGKWKVDTSYVQHRSSDVSNLEKKAENKDAVQYSDPATTKFPYEAIKGADSRPVEVDPARKELYLSDEEFLTVMGATPGDFAKMPKWKQQNTKKAKGLF